MLKTAVNKLLMVIYFVLGALILEAVTFSILNFSGMPEYFLLNFAIILFVAILVYAIPNYTAQYVIYTIVLLVQTVFIYVNYSLLTVFGDLFSFEMLAMTGEAGKAMTSSFVYFGIILQLISVFLLISLTGGMLLSKCKKDKINIKQHFSIFNVIILISLQCFAVGYYADTRRSIDNAVVVTDKEYTQSDTFLMNNPFLKYNSYKKFGTYGYFTNLITREIIGYNKEMQQTALDYFNAGEIYDGTFKDENNNTVSNQVFGGDKGNNVIVVMMESLEWYAFGDGNYDANFNNLSPELTPNVYSIIYGDYEYDDINKSYVNKSENDDSIIAKNFFAKSKTNISEGFGVMGSYPVGESLSSEVAGKNSYIEYSMPQILKELGYTTNYVHSNEIEFYDRAYTHEKLGFENVIGKDSVIKDGKQLYKGADLEWGHWENEEEFVKNAMEYIVPSNYNEKPFYSFYLNVSSHGSYEYNKYNKDCVRYVNFVMYGEDDCYLDEKGNYQVKKEIAKEDLTYTNWYQNVIDNYYETDKNLCKELLYYQCGVVGMDAAIGAIKEQLKTYGIEDKTTILLYSDHNAYYDSMSNRFKGIPLDNFASIKLNTIPMILSSPSIKEYNKTASNKFIVNDRFTSAYDIVPTLLDLLGIKYNQNLYIGQSMFKPADYVYEIDGETKDMIVYHSNTGGMFSKDIYTFDFKTYNKENIAVDDEITEMFVTECNNVLRKVSYLNILNHYQMSNKLSFIWSN